VEVLVEVLWEVRVEVLVEVLVEVVRHPCQRGVPAARNRLKRLWILRQ
jgi:hypothetical protein